MFVSIDTERGQVENGGSQDPKPRLLLPQTKTYFTKKKKYYQFITSLLLEEPLCTAWLTSARARPTRAEGRAQQRGPRPGPAVQGRRGQPGSRLPLPCPPPRPSAKGLSSGEEGWRAEGVYSPACRTRFSWGGGGTSPGSPPAVASPAVSSPLFGPYSQFYTFVTREKFTESSWMPWGWTTVSLNQTYFGPSLRHKKNWEYGPQMTRFLYLYCKSQGYICMSVLGSACL